MVNQKIVDYLKEQKEAGFSEKQLKDALLKYGYNAQEIDQAIASMHSSPPAPESSQSQAPQQPAPQSGQNVQQTQASKAQHSGQNPQDVQTSQNIQQAAQPLQSSQAPQESPQPVQNTQQMNVQQGQQDTQTPIQQQSAAHALQNPLDTDTPFLEDGIVSQHEFKERNPAVVLVAGILTLGIYYLYWAIDTHEQLKSHAPLPHWALMILPVINLIYFWKFFKAVKEVTGQSYTTLFIVFLIFPPAAFMMTQSHLNKA